MIEAVILDIGGVLCSYSGGDLDGRWERRLGLRAGDLRRRLWDTPVQRAAERGEIEFERFWHEATTQLGLDDGQRRELYEECWRSTELDPLVEGWARSLRPRYKVATLSNSWSDGRRECVSRWGLDQLVDAMVFSAEEGMAKPDPEIYLLTLRRLGVAARNALFVDDRLENVEAAVRLGMTAMRIDSAAGLLDQVAPLVPA